jgi:hypothetical protein
MSLLGVKRTCCFAAHMSAYDPKRISAGLPSKADIPIAKCLPAT